MILPGSTIGVLGSGQLGRMFALAAREMGFRVHVLSPDRDSPTGQIADREVVASYLDLDRVAEFARGVDVVTFEFENVPAASTEAAARHAPVRPSGAVLHVTQHRLREKQFLTQAGFPVTPFRAARSAQDLAAAAAELGPPVIAKTAGWGYDGKGQVRLHRVDEAPRAWAELATDEVVVEAVVDFERELSVVAARGLDGTFAAWPVVENHHRHHILDLTLAPAPLPSALAREAAELARGVLSALDVVGVMAVELFLARDGRLLVNELAPRPHNSGHWTIDAATTSQFEQQLRAVCGLPLGDPSPLAPAAMANLLGELWADGEPHWPAALAIPGVRLHLYGKTAPRLGRKMGHLTALAPTVEQAAERARAARAALTSPAR